jgi:hypothetical protein
VLPGVANVVANYLPYRLQATQAIEAWYHCFIAWASRLEFVATLGSAAALWPLAGRAQQSGPAGGWSQRASPGTRRQPTRPSAPLRKSTGFVATSTGTALVGPIMRRPSMPLRSGCRTNGSAKSSKRWGNRPAACGSPKPLDQIAPSICARRSGPNGCRFRILDSSVPMVQPAKDWMRNNVSEPLDWARVGSVLPSET